MEGLLQDVDTAQQAVGRMIMHMKACQERLSQIALRPTAMPSDKYVEMMIQNEKNNQKPGFSGRIRALETIKKKAILLQEATDSNFDPLKDFKVDASIKKMLKSSKKKSGAVKGFFSSFGLHGR